MSISNKNAEALIQHLKVLVVDDSAFARKITRALLNNLGIKAITEASDGIAALEVIRQAPPDVIILDWEMPLLNGPELVRIVRSPGVFPAPDVPIIMLSSHGDKRRVLEALTLGVNEFLCKPVSAKALLDRLVSILAKARESVQLDGYYGPALRAPKLDGSKPTGLSK
ncbi:MAG: response regulator [Pseudolabrys sp.]|nr:response regulator [Pseudolabrys sp.]